MGDLMFFTYDVTTQSYNVILQIKNIPCSVFFYL